MASRVALLRGELEIVGSESIGLDKSVSFDEIVTHPRYEIASSQTDHQISFGSVTTATVIHFHTDVAITYNLDGTGDTDHTLSAQGDVTIMDGSHTSLHITTTNAAVLTNIVIAGT